MHLICCGPAAYRSGTSFVLPGSFPYLLRLQAMYIDVVIFAGAMSGVALVVLPLLILRRVGVCHAPHAHLHDKDIRPHCTTLLHVLSVRNQIKCA